VRVTEQQGRESDHGPAGQTEPDAPRSSSFSWWLGLILGVAAALVGLLPWIVSGMRLPLQNLWATDTMPDRMPVAFLPLSQYALTSIVALLVVGPCAAGILVRATRRRWSEPSLWALLGGVLVVQVAAAAQAVVVVYGGLQVRLESALYSVVLALVALVGIVFGAVVLVLVGRAPRAGALIGMVLAAPLAASWLAMLVVPQNSGLLVGGLAAGLTRWVPAVLVGVAIAWCGVGTAGRIVAAVVSLVLLWIVPVLITAVNAAVGTRVLASRPDEMIAYGAEVFRMAAGTAGESVPPLILGLVLAAVGLVLRRPIARLVYRGRE
jgi:hypothetical protein